MINTIDGNLAKDEKVMCEYRGKQYYVLTDFETQKCFIEVNNKKLFLDCNGKVANKQPNTRNVKDCISSYEDMNKIYHHLINEKRWNIFLLFVLNYNLSRRIGDLLKCKWIDFYSTDWRIKKYWTLTEGKTGKKNEIKINKAVVNAFHIYLENVYLEKTKENLNECIFKNLHGSHKGKVITEEGYRLALIKVQKELSLDKQLRSHGFRRGAFTNMIESHPNDPKAKTIVMDISKHSNEQMLCHYIGESDKNKETYLDDLGEDFNKYVVDGEEVPFHKKVPQVTCNTSKLLASMREAATYFMVKGIESANETDTAKIIEIVNQSMERVEEILEEIVED